MNRFDIANIQLNTRIAEKASVTITYHRGDKSTVITAGIAGRYMFRTMDQGNMRVEWSDRDYLIPSTALLIDGTQTTPQDRDWIEEEINGVVKTFRPAAPTNEQNWRYADTEETQIRIHCAKWVRV